MHLLAVQPGGFVQDAGIISSLGQTPANIVILSAADTSLALLASAYEWWQKNNHGALLPSLRLANLIHLRQHASVDLYEDEVLRHAQFIVVDHLGGEGYWPYGIERLQSLAKNGCGLVLLSGDHHFDDNLLRKSNIPEPICRALWKYLRCGGINNAKNMLNLCMEIWKLISKNQQKLYFNYQENFNANWGKFLLKKIEAPQSIATLGVYHPAPIGFKFAHLFSDLSAGISQWENGDENWGWKKSNPIALLILYRAHVLSVNMRIFEEFMQILRSHNLNPLPLVVRSLKDPNTVGAIAHIRAKCSIHIVINTTAFAANSDLENFQNNHISEYGLTGNIPILQAIISGSNAQAWAENPQGLGPRDVAMHIALPEVDGRILTRVISFKTLARRSLSTQCDLVQYESMPTHMDFVAKLAVNYAKLQKMPAQEKRLAIILASYPNRSQAQLGAGVGLDTPASVIAILHALKNEGYCIDNIPENGTQLMQILQNNYPVAATQYLSLEQYLQFFHSLPDEAQRTVIKRWGNPVNNPDLQNGQFTIQGFILNDLSKGTGAIFVGIQPSRLSGDNHNFNELYDTYHSPDIPPPHGYIAFYAWLNYHFCANAVVHCGKHGNLEWLPGKSVALSDHCWPQALLGPVPHIYPFIVNDPGEGAQAKRRTHATLIGHLMPPIMRAQIHGPLRHIEQLADEYYAALSMDMRRAQVLRREIVQCAIAAELHRDLGWSAAPQTPEAEDTFIAQADAWLCALKDSQIRDGLHVFGQDLQGAALVQTAFALLAAPSALGEVGLLQALSEDLALNTGADAHARFDPHAQQDAQAPWLGPRPAALAQIADGAWRTHAHTRERLQALATACLQQFLAEHFGAQVLEKTPNQPQSPSSEKANLGRGCPAHWQDFAQTAALLRRAAQALLPRLLGSAANEMRQFLRACAGEFVPSGPSGAPTRGRWDVLPTGRNFFSVDPRAVPTPTSWRLAQQSAATLVEKYLQDEGEYPRAMGLNVWGTATMRTGGEDFAMALALIGARPRWGQNSARVEDFEIIPIAALGRPRVDVTLRASGFFRDAFGHLLELFEAAVTQIAELADENAHDNPIRAHVLQQRQALQAQPQDPNDAQTAWRASSQRVFAPRAGTFGSGIGHMLDSGQWQHAPELARAWLAHSAFDWRGQRVAAQQDLLAQIQRWDMIAQHLDNPETDMLEGSEHAQFLGAMASAAAHLPQNPEQEKPHSEPRLYVLDSTSGERTHARDVAQELARVVRTRLTNPQWHAAIARHGYKGGFEALNALEALFAFAATTRSVRDDQFHAVSHALLLDHRMNDFLRTHNPHALRQGCERMLEAAARGLWHAPDLATIEQLRTQLLEMEDALEH